MTVDVEILAVTSHGLVLLTWQNVLISLGALTGALVVFYVINKIKG